MDTFSQTLVSSPISTGLLLLALLLPLLLLVITAVTIITKLIVVIKCYYLLSQVHNCHWSYCYSVIHISFSFPYNGFDFANYEQ